VKYYQKDDQKEQGVCVVARDGEPLTDLIKRFKKKYSKSGLNKEVRSSMFYVKRGDAKRMKRKSAQRMRQRDAEKNLKKLKVIRNKRKGETNENSSSSKRQSSSRDPKTKRSN
jgi:ribosomal protein S21